jgi:Na+-transporting methylmalonyl-CoA/oxaloacetate decarboxylase gamma subunit
MEYESSEVLGYVVLVLLFLILIILLVRFMSRGFAGKWHRPQKQHSEANSNSDQKTSTTMTTNNLVPLNSIQSMAKSGVSKATTAAAADAGSFTTVILNDSKDDKKNITDDHLFSTHAVNWTNNAIRVLPGFRVIPPSWSDRLVSSVSRASKKAFSGSPPNSIFFGKQDVSSRVPLLQVFFGIGINYYGTSNELPTCNNDLLAFRKWWRKRVVWPSSSSRVYEFLLTDLPTASAAFGQLPNVSIRKPTVREWYGAAAAIVKLIQTQIAAGGQAELVCYSSSHGFFQLTTNLSGDLHGRCECLVMTDGFVWDYEAYARLIDPLPSADCHMIGVSDQCHSGTFWNLFQSVNRLSGECNQENLNSGTRACCWSLSGSLDNETASAGFSPSDLSIYTASFLRLIGTNEKSSPQTFITNQLQDLRGRKQAQTPLLSVSDCRLAQVPFFS